MTTKIFAHRGASMHAPENTMPAFQLAYEHGADGIETDVQLTKDNIPVLIHDEQVKRTTNGSGFVKDLTLHELKQLDLGAWFSPDYRGTTILSLEEFLQWIEPKSLYLNIELKNTKINYKNLESIVHGMLSRYQLLDRTTLSTFNPVSIRRLREHYHDLDIAFLTSRRNRKLVRNTRILGANALHVKYRLLRPSLVDACRQTNMELRVYTVNRAVQMHRCFTLRTDGIITDVPDLAVQQRKIYQSEQTN
ncbi:glycerophosphodiester phosphodiesterase [Lentibacillus songyuanensis]|uniref:glycerophosphodiester phosphodiesterase n=1 Tax=Lentibacillus songyuanensis TaxID=3136161 RepID=UPI0038621CA4